jgi:hypothetical protein
MNKYGYCIFEDISGDLKATEQGFTSIESARRAAVKECEWYTDSSPRGYYSWDVYDVLTNETVEVSE